MSDPAVEAAGRACTKHGFGDIKSAREALKPIQERHAHWVAELEKSPLPATAGAIALVVLADLAPLIFTTEELER